MQRSHASTQASWDAIVIGSGIGGLTCAAALAKSGWKVLVLEQHYVAGGCTHMFSRKGYHWDVGVHCVGEMHAKHANARIIDWLSDGKIRMNPLGRAYDSFHFPDGFEMELPDRKEKFRTLLKEAFPEEHAAIDRYFETIEVACEKTKFWFIKRLLPEWMDRVAGPLVSALGAKWWTRSTREVIDSITSNERLKAVLTAQWGYYGATPSKSAFSVHALTVKHFWNGGYYPSGGAKVFADHFVETIRAAGGDVWTRKSVEEILLRNGRAVGVRLDTGEVILAGRVISATGAKTTADKLLPEDAPAPARAWREEIRSLEQSPTYVTLYLGLEGDVKAAGGTLANQWRFETWDMEQGEWDVRDPDSIAPFLYISFPSLKDPQHDPGPTLRHTMEVVTFVPWDAFEKWKHTRRGKREKDYMEFKKGVEERLFAQVARHLPGIVPLVRYRELSTPLSTQFFIRAPQGAIYGLAPDLKRFRSKALRTRTPIPRLYMAGCDVAILGVAGAMTGGILAAGTLEPRVLPRLF